jgi:capsular polysaccharide biosynthesis protein
MAKKRKMVRRKAAKAKPARRSRSKKSDPDETMNIIAGILVVILIGLGIYFYQTTQKTGAIEAPTQVAMVMGTT